MDALYFWGSYVLDPYFPIHISEPVPYVYEPAVVNMRESCRDILEDRGAHPGC